LRSIGQALQAYHATYGMFPSAHYADKNSSKGDPIAGKHISPFCHLLAELDQPQLFAEMNFEKAQQFDSFEPPIARVRVPVFRCPSDGNRLSAGQFEMGNINYRVSIGVGPGTLSHLDHAGRAGAFNTFDWTRDTSFKDGLGATAGVSEKLVGDGQPARFDRRRDFWYTAAESISPSPGALDIAEVMDICQSLRASNPPHYSWAGRNWVVEGYENTFYNHLATPNTPTADCSMTYFHPLNPPWTGKGLFAARSNHSGGVNVLMMDGAVRFISDSIALEIWRAIATRDGGEKVDVGEL
jgi:prepilin-type processing-associated H-X9-DG protein